MSHYENPPVDHSVNTSSRSPLGEFASLSAWLALGTAMLVVALTLGARWLVPWVPFEWEMRMAQRVVPHVLAGLAHAEQAAPPAAANPPAANGPALPERRRAWLQALADGLRPAMGMQAMPVTIHWSADPSPNALATLGGHIVIHQGLLDRAHSENALAMVLAHEMAHVKHRDALVGLGSGLVLGVGVGLLFGHGTLAGEAATALSQLHFSRDQERAADAAALQALHTHYGHTTGAEDVFVQLQCEQPAGAMHAHGLDWLSSHPDTGGRIAQVQTQRQVRSPAAVPTVRALPAWMHHEPPSPCGPAAKAP